MLTKFSDSNEINTLASNEISSYIKDGYRIDAKESVIDHDKDKDCTFKAVLKKDVDGIECKTVITLTDNGDDKNKSCMYHKVDTVGDTRWSEETRTYSSSIASCASKDDHAAKFWDTLANDDFYGRYVKTKDGKDTKKWRSALDFPPSTYQRLDDYIKLNDDKKDDGVKIKFTTPSGKEVEVKDMRDQSVRVESADDRISVDAKDSMDDIYNKIVDRRKNLEACNAKARADKKKIPIESLIEKKDSREDDDELEDSLIKLVRYIFGR